MDQIKPKRIDGRKRNQVFVRVNAKEAKKIAKLMLKSGKTGQQLMREALFSRTDLATPLHTKEQADILFVELKKVGERINEFAKELNSGKEIPNREARINSFTAAFIRLRLMFTGVIPMEPSSIASSLPAMSTT